MTQRLPVTTVGGYLGAGKTTLINHMLRHAAGQRLAVLVNEFGEIAATLISLRLMLANPRFGPNQILPLVSSRSAEIDGDGVLAGS